MYHLKYREEKGYPSKPELLEKEKPNLNAKNNESKK